MFTPNHYVPILKWKRGEQNALQALSDKEKNVTTPIIELVMPTVSLYRIEGERKSKKKIKKSIKEISTEVVQKFKEKRVNEIPEEILKSWGIRPVFLDFTLLYVYGDAQLTTQLKADSLNKIILAGVNVGLKIIPVLNLNDDLKIKEAVIAHNLKYNQGICLRVAPSDLADTVILNEKIKFLLKNFGIFRKNIDLLIDIKEKGGQYLQFINASQKIDNLSEWRNFIFAYGAFPENLLKCKLDEPKFLPRFDWQNWLSLVKEKNLIRNPIFADYTIRNPIFKEDTQYYRSTPSIKYTLKNDWLILKGKMHQSEHYLVNAKLLVEDMTNTFCSEQHCWGDKNIAEKAKYYHQYIRDVKSGKLKKGEGTGQSSDWIAWSINHHIIQVLSQIASLSYKPTKLL